MGTIVHHSLIISAVRSSVSESERVPDGLDIVHADARLMGLRPSPISEMGTNGWAAFFTPPCGSKLGWKTAEEHLSALGALILGINLYNRETHRLLNKGAISPYRALLHYVETVYGETTPRIGRYNDGEDEG